LPLPADASEIWNYNSTPRPEKSNHNKCQQFSTRLIPVPIGVIDVYSEYENSENIYMNKSGSCNIGKDDTPKNWQSYDVEYMTQRIPKSSFEHKLIEV